MAATNSIAKNTLYQAIGKVFGIGFGLLAFAIMARYLGPEQFGAYSTAVTFVSIFGTLADLGLPVVHLRLLSLRRKTSNDAIANLHTIRLASTMLVLGLGLVIARLFPYGPDVQTGILIVTVGFLSVSFTQYLLAIFQEKLVTARYAIAEVVGRAVMFGIVLLTARLDFGLVTIFWATTLGSAAAFLLTIFFARRLGNLRLGFKLNLWSGLLKQALALMFVSIFSLIYFKIDTLLLSVLKDLTAVGIYSAAYKFMDVFITFPALFTALVLPFFARASADEERQRLAYLFQRAFRAIMLAALPLAVLTFLEADRLIIFTSGSGFLESGLVLQILSLAVVGLFLGNLGTTILIALGKAKYVAWIFGVAAVLGVALYFFTIDRFGYLGAAWSTVAIESSIAITSIAIVIIRVRRAPVAHYFVRTIISAAGLGVALYFGRTIPLLANLALGGSTYLLLLFATQAITNADIRSVLGLAARSGRPSH